MVDILLALGVALFPMALAFMGGYVAVRTPNPEHHVRWLWAFGIVGVLGMFAVALAAGWAGHEQEETKRDLNSQLTELRISQGRNEGETKAIREIMEGVAKTGIPGLREFAESVLGELKNNKQVPQNTSTLTDAQLCNRTTSLAQKIRSFEADFRSNDPFGPEKWFPQMAGKTREEQQAIFQKNVQQDTQRRKTHEEQFVSEFLSDVKYDHDQIIDRLPAARRDQLVNHNRQEEASISSAQLVGVDDGYQLASYLDQLAKALCSKK
jgi:hypothetical protein